MTDVKDIVEYCDQLLEASSFKDYCPNGLQVQGKEKIKKIVSGVTSSEALIDAAIYENADALLVHHGYFWSGENPVITGIKYNRIAKLIQHNISLIAYHLPLDAHVELGNNAQLAKVLGVSVDDRFATHGDTLLGFVSFFDEPKSGVEFKSHIANALQREPLYIQGTSEPIKKLAWCTGGAQDAILTAFEYGADAFLTGEVSERTVHFARENQMHFYAAGHHATERYGAKALGEHLAEKFSLQHVFIDIDNPA